MEQSFFSLARNEDWLANTLDNIICSQDAQADEGPDKLFTSRTAAGIEERILRCLGAAVILKRTTISIKLQREQRGSMRKATKNCRIAQSDRPLSAQKQR